MRAFFVFRIEELEAELISRRQSFNTPENENLDKQLSSMESDLRISNVSYSLILLLCAIHFSFSPFPLKFR